MTDDCYLMYAPLTEHLPVLAEDSWLAKLCGEWQLPDIVGLTPWGPRLVILLWRKCDE